MHCLLYHIPYFISMYGSLKMFSGQGVEKNNDIVKMIHQRKSSKWDGPTDALKVRKRLEFAHQENVGVNIINNQIGGKETCIPLVVKNVRKY